MIGKLYFPEIKRVEKEDITCNEMIIFFAITIFVSDNWFNSIF